MPTEHALLSASGANRWLACPPSALLERKYANKDTDYTREGTTAHALAELTLRRTLNQLKPEPEDRNLTVAINSIIETAPYYTPEMLRHVGEYVETVLVEASRMGANYGDIQVEVRLDFSPWVPEGFGTADALIVTPKRISVIDFKYGKGVRVYAEDNPQLRLYALGAYDSVDFLYNITDVTTMVVQPRLGHIDTEELTRAEFLAWGESIKPIAALAYKGKGELNAGEHCKWCRHKTACPKMLSLADEMARMAFDAKEDGSYTTKLTPEGISELLEKQTLIADFLKDFSEYALTQARDNGLKIPGYKLVESKTNRKYSDENAVEQKLLANNITDIYKPVEILGIAAIEKLLGKGGAEELIGEYIVKPEGAPMLAPLSDRREEWRASVTAAEAFSE